jgi:hypothetical protein
MFKRILQNICNLLTNPSVLFIAFILLDVIDTWPPGRG